MNGKLLNRIPTVKQPNIHKIKSELTVWHQWKEAYLRKEKERPELPQTEDVVHPIVIYLDLFVRSFIVILGWFSKKVGASQLRFGCALLRVRLDWMVLCRAGCSLNAAYTELGLAALNIGDITSAIECLKKSWRVHPCPHNMSYGLSTKLWNALAKFPEAETARIEYEKVARSFTSYFGLPRKKLTLSELIKVFYRAIREAETDE